MTSAQSGAQSIDFFFDPICPWAWAASRWMVQVQAVRPVSVRWRLFSLSAVFAERDKPEQFAQALELGWGSARAVVAAEALSGQEAVLALYNELGQRMHVDEQRHTPEMIADTVATVGLDERIAAAVTDETWDEVIWAEHAAAVAAVGEEIGTPVLGFESGGFFGPVLTHVPKGEAAGQLFDGIELCVNTPGFCELKRGRDLSFPDLSQ